MIIKMRPVLIMYFVIVILWSLLWLWIQPESWIDLLFYVFPLIIFTISSLAVEPDEDVNDQECKFAGILVVAVIISSMLLRHLDNESCMSKGSIILFLSFILVLVAYVDIRVSKKYVQAMYTIKTAVRTLGLTLLAYGMYIYLLRR